MPEFDTVRCFAKDLRKHIRPFDSPEGPTIFKGISYMPRNKASGADFTTDPHDREAIAALGTHRPIHSVQQIGTIIEILLPRDDFDPEAEEEQVVDAIRLVFKNYGQVGTIDETDKGKYPAAHLPGTEWMEHGRSRVSAIIECENMEGGKDSIMLLDALSHVNFAMVKVKQRTVRREDGGLGGERWFLRAYGQGYDPIEAPYKWAQDMADALRGRNGRALTGTEFTGPLALAENQRRVTLLQALDSKYGFSGLGFRIKSEVGGINWIAQRKVYRSTVWRPGQERRYSW